MKRNTLYKQKICIFIYGLLFFILFTVNLLAANPKSEIIRRKLTEIIFLCEKITENKIQAIKIREQLCEKMTGLKEEIRSKQKLSNIKTYKEAVRFPEIDFNLMLVEQILFNIFRIDKRIEYLQNSKDELEFLYQKAEDDLKIIETLNDMEVEKLMIQINQGLDKYHPEKKTFIKPDYSSLNSLEKIWREIVNK